MKPDTTIARVVDDVAIECPSSRRALRAAKTWEEMGDHFGGLWAVAVWVWLFRWAELRSGRKALERSPTNK